MEFGHDSVVLSVKYLDENHTISSLEFRWQLGPCCCSKDKKIWTINLARVLITPNEQATFEMREEVLSSVGAQDTDTRGCELSDLEDIEFRWEDPAVDMDNVY